MNRRRAAGYAALLALTIAVFLSGVGQFCLLNGYWWLCVFVRACALSALVIPPTIMLSRRYKVFDLPDSRKSHREPTPRTGGIAIFAAVYVLTLHYWRFDRALLGICLGASIIFIVGLADDLKGLPATIKLIGQLLAALVVIYFGVVISVVPRGWPAETFLEAVITVVWIIGVVNAVNFLDGIDGLVATLGILCALVFFVLTFRTFQQYVAYLCIALAGACAGFLPYNFRFWRHTAKGRIFLGDSGSTLIGFLLAAIAIMGSWANDNAMVALSTPVLVLGVSIFDMIYITVARVKRRDVRTLKQWIDFVGKDHFHHRLMRLGLSERAAVAFIALVTIVLGVSALLIPLAGQIGALLLLFQAFCIFIIVVILMLSGRELS